MTAPLGVMTKGTVNLGSVTGGAFHRWTGRTRTLPLGTARVFKVRIDAGTFQRRVYRNLPPTPMRSQAK